MERLKEHFESTKRAAIAVCVIDVIDIIPFIIAACGFIVGVLVTAAVTGYNTGRNWVCHRVTE